MNKILVKDNLHQQQTKATISQIKKACKECSMYPCSGFKCDIPNGEISCHVLLSNLEIIYKELTIERK
jgi:hypothetical protein